MTASDCGAATAARVVPLAGNALRITHPDAHGALPADRPWLALVAPAIADPPDARSFLRITDEAGDLTVRTADGVTLLRAVGPPRWRDQRVQLRFETHRNERFFGGGAWFDAFGRLRGRVHLRARESPSVLQGGRTYSALPFFLSSRGYGLLFLNAHESLWEFDDAGHLTITAGKSPADYVVIHGPTPREIITTYTALTGRPPLVPRWAFGLWVTGYPQAAQDGVLAHVAEHRRRHVPLDAVILDYHWEARFHDFRWRRALFPDPDALIRRLRDQGIRLGLIFTPFVNARNVPWQKWLLHRIARNLPPGHEHDDERARPEYEDAWQRGLFAHDDTRWWFGRGGMLDWTNPAAARWWTEKLRPLYAQGVAFFKNDDGEYLPDDARSQLGMDGREYHNQYGFHYGRALYEDMIARDDRRGLVFARSVWLGSQRYPALFLGDQQPTFRSLRRTIRAGLNLSVCGFSYWGADVFGLDGPTTPETHARYAQWALCTPIARYFIRPPVIDDTRRPWAHDAVTAESFRRHVELRYRLLPYYCALGWEAYETGVPIMRPLFVEFPDDPRAWTIDDQAMLGDALLLAPVITSGATRRRIVLPPGTWHDWWTPATWSGGGTIDYPAPIDRLPLLVRGGRLIPTGPPLQSIPDTHRFRALEIHAFPPYPARCRVIDDDGTTRAYTRGASTVIEVTVTPTSNGLRITTVPIHTTPGADLPARIAWTIVLHRTTPALRLTSDLDDTTMSHDAVTATTRIACGCATDRAGVVDVEWPWPGA